MEEGLVFTVQGSIAVGKTTLLDGLAARGWSVIPEPVAIWQSFHGHNLLEAFYRGEISALDFQALAFVTRASTWPRIRQHTDAEVVIVERGVFVDKFVFERMLHDSGRIGDAEHWIYVALWEFFNAHGTFVEPTANIHIALPPEAALERIQLRGRLEEQGITLEYLQRLEDYHRRWRVSDPRAVVLDGVLPEDRLLAAAIEAIEENISVLVPA